jgi:hypothetical protein
LVSTNAAAADAPDKGAAANGGLSVDIVLNGHITPKCTVGGGGNIDLGQLNADKNVSARFDVACNVPFEMVFRSSAGGIAHVEKPQGEGPYAGIVPYRLGVTVPALSPLPTQLHADFTSGQMVAGGTLDSGDAIAAGGGEIRLQTEMMQGRDLLAGKYADSIMIVINPRV